MPTTRPDDSSSQLAHARWELHRSIVQDGAACLTEVVFSVDEDPSASIIKALLAMGVTCEAMSRATAKLGEDMRLNPATASRVLHGERESQPRTTYILAVVCLLAQMEHGRDIAEEEVPRLAREMASEGTSTARFSPLQGKLEAALTA